MKVFSEIKTGTDGREYGIRYLLTDEEASWLRRVGLVGQLYEVVGMKAVADMAVAAIELDNHVGEGGAVQ
jgi:hypothetical protein